MTRISRTAGTLVVVTALALLAPALHAQRQVRSVFVSAVDASGGPVANLTAADFKVKEGDNERTITAAGLANGPMRIVLLLDTGSNMGPFLAQLRTGLSAFLDLIPAQHEIGIMVLGGHSRALQQPTTDRVKLKSLATKFSLDGGGVAFLDGLREGEDRFQKKPGVKWPVYVMLVTDENEASGTMQNDELNRIMADLTRRATTVHAALLEKMGPTNATQIAATLAKNSGGDLESITTPAALPDLLTKIAKRIVSDADAMATRYQVDYESDAKYSGSVNVTVQKDGVRGSISLKRPF